MELDLIKLKKFITEALVEDLSHEGDHSALASIPANQEGQAQLIIKGEGILAGIEVAKYIYELTDNTLKIDWKLKDGDHVKYGEIGFIISGNVHTILKTERLVLNLMQRLSGIATATNLLVKETEGTKTKILDTRKTTPNLRFLEKWAVTIGGGYNHRIGLYDMIMLKDNHVDYAGGIENAIDKTQAYLQKNKLDLKVEIETRNIEEVEKVVRHGGINRIMLDNFSPEEIKKALKIIAGKYETEASGGIDIQTIKDYAATGVDYISIGAITHSVKSLDISLKVLKK